MALPTAPVATAPRVPPIMPFPVGCPRCGHVHPAGAPWPIKCAGCGRYLPLPGPPPTKGPAPARTGPGILTPARLAEIPADRQTRLPTTFGELDRVLGGGLVPGSMVLLRGEPGAGKSTLLLQVAAAVADSTHRSVLYVAAEESPAQVAARGRRLTLPAQGRVHVLGRTDILGILSGAAVVKPALLIVDSLHACADSSLPAAPGTPSQVMATCQHLLAFARGTATPVVAVVHVNADFAVRGGYEIVHQVDASLALERGPLLRMLRADKNRFGDVDEVGLFTMETDGMHGLPSGAALLDDASRDGLPGVAIAATLEGSRVLLAEVQALVAPAKFVTPRVASTGYPADRLAMVMAVLERRVGLPRLANADIFLTIAGGMRLRDPAADLAVALAVASSAREVPLPPNIAAAGEVDLSGRVRRVPRLDDRAKEGGRAGLRLWSSVDAATLTAALNALDIGGGGAVQAVEALEQGAAG